jgi:transcriptional regulatory protein LevR
MKKLFEISSEEKQRILEMHESATKKNYLSEQAAQQTPPKPKPNPSYTDASKVKYYLPFITDADTFSKFAEFDMTVDALKSVGVNVTKAPEVKLDATTKEMKANWEAYLVRLIENYLQSIPMTIRDTNTICKGNTNEIVNNFVISNGKKLFKAENKFEAEELFKYFKLNDEKFKNVVANAVKINLNNNFPEVCAG